MDIAALSKEKANSFDLAIEAKVAKFRSHTEECIFLDWHMLIIIENYSLNRTIWVGPKFNKASCLEQASTIGEVNEIPNSFKRSSVIYILDIINCIIVEIISSEMVKSFPNKDSQCSITKVFHILIIFIYCKSRKHHPRRFFNQSFWSSSEVPTPKSIAVRCLAINFKAIDIFKFLY